MLGLPLCRACCSFSRLSSWTMLSICFCKSTTAASFVVSESRHTRKKIHRSYLKACGNSVIKQLWCFKAGTTIKQLLSITTVISISCSPDLPFFTAFFFTGVCWNEPVISSSTPSITHTPLNSIVRPVEWGWINVDARNLSLSLPPALCLSLSHPPSHPPEEGKMPMSKVLFVGITVQPQKPLRMVCAHRVWLQTFLVEVEG